MDSSTDSQKLQRLLDAVANRAGEGLRVAEDYVRFVLDDAYLTEQWKKLRHDLASCLRDSLTLKRFAARQVADDVGVKLTTAGETSRESPSHVFHANATRLQQALRSLEEYSKLIDPAGAQAIEAIRYRSYELAAAVATTRDSLDRLQLVKLYVLLDGQQSADAFEDLVCCLMDAGVHAIQLRDKRLRDRDLLQRARQLRSLTRESPCLFIMNDRPDLAAVSRADGVHVGQDELSVKDARAIVGPEAIVGVSTHSIQQARQAVLDSANYIGVGPTFASQTKEFAEFPGIDFVKQVSAEIRLPAFAIGGITLEHLPKVQRAGLGRVAVGAAITASPAPELAARNFLAALG